MAFLSARCAPCPDHRGRHKRGRARSMGDASSSRSRPLAPWRAHEAESPGNILEIGGVFQRRIGMRMALADRSFSFYSVKGANSQIIAHLLPKNPVVLTYFRKFLTFRA